MTDGYVCTLDANAELEDFFTYNEQWGVVEYCIYVPYSDDYQTQGRALVDALKGRGYTLSSLDVLVLDEELYKQVDSTARFGKLPEGYRFRLKSGHYDEWHFKWIENTGLAYMTEKYGNRFRMTLDGTILCTEPEYQDWNIVIENNTDKEYEDRDNFAVRLHRDGLEEILLEIAQPIFGECRVYVIGGRSSELGPDTEPEDFLTYKRVKWPYDMRLPDALVRCCVCVPYREDYKTCGEALMPKVLERGYLPFKITILFLDPEQYRQTDRAGAVQLAGRDNREGYRARLLTQCNGDFEPEIERYWDEAE